MDLREQVQQALDESAIFDLRSLQVEQHNGTVVLSGSVSRYYYKQLAQELVFCLCSDHQLVNTIRVRQ
jgi:osmotically-inducible protein OsmY